MYVLKHTGNSCITWRSYSKSTMLKCPVGTIYTNNNLNKIFLFNLSFIPVDSIHIYDVRNVAGLHGQQNRNSVSGYDNSV